MAQSITVLFKVDQCVKKLRSLKDPGGSLSIESFSAIVGLQGESPMVGYYLVWFGIVVGKRSMSEKSEGGRDVRQ